MHWKTLLAIGAAATGLILGQCGCRSDVQPVGVDNGDQDEHAHHDHGSTGPNGGHLIELEGPSLYHAEWLHDDELGRITVYVLDEHAEAEVPIEAAEIAIRTAIEGQDPKVYQLPAVGSDAGTSAQFQLDNQELLTALQVGEGVDAVLELEIDGQSYHGHIEHHHGDGHAH